MLSRMLVVTIALLCLPIYAWAGPTKKHHTTDLNATLAAIDQQEKKQESKLNARIPLKQRRKMYYAIMKAIVDAISHPTIPGDNNATTAINLKRVYRKYHITADQAGILRTEGDRAGWPEPMPHF